MTTATERQAAIDLLVADGTIQPIEDGEVPTEAQIDKSMAVDNWISDLGGHDDAAIVVYEIDAKSNKPIYIESLGVQEMDGPMLFEKLKNEYGGGKFRIQMRADGAIRKTQTVEIKKQVATVANGGPMQDLPALIRELKGDDSGGNTELILNMMQQSNAQFQQMIATIVTAMGSNNNQPAVDPMAMQTSMLEGIAQMQKLAGLNKTEKNPTDLILEGVKLVGAIKDSGEGGEANIYSVLTKAIGGFGDTLGQAMNLAPPAGMQPPGAPPQTLQQIGDANASNPAEETAPGETPLGTPTLPADHPLAPYEPFVDWMLSLAQKNANPELYAEVIIDQIGPEMAYAWLSTNEGLAALQENLPKSRPYANWLMLVGREVAAITDDGSHAPGVDESPASVDNPGEVQSNQEVDVSAGHDSPGPGTHDATPIDGDSERPGGDQSNVTIDGEFSESSEDDAANT